MKDNLYSVAQDSWQLGPLTLHSRFILGSGKFRLDLIEAALNQAEAEIITLAVRRANSAGEGNILQHIPEHIHLLPIHRGAKRRRSLSHRPLRARTCCGDMVKIEIMRDSKYLLPDNHETIKATEILASEGFIVMPYMYQTLMLRRFSDCGAACVMPLGAQLVQIVDLKRRHLSKYCSMRLIYL